MPSVTTCIAFDNQAEAAVEFYVRVVPESRVIGISRFGVNGPGPVGAVRWIAFELAGHRLHALNGGPYFSFTEGVSVVLGCDTQAEIDYLWRALSEEGSPGPCGWLIDRFGVSWQILPRSLEEWTTGVDQERSDRVIAALLEMGKPDLDLLRAAYEGTEFDAPS